MSHKSMDEQKDRLRKYFIERRCEMPFHFCATGEPIPIDGRIQIPGWDKELRKRSPCEHYKPGQGCTNVRHPKYSREWKLLSRDRRGGWED